MVSPPFKLLQMSDMAKNESCTVGRPQFRKVTRAEFLLAAVGAQRSAAFPPVGPEYHFKDGRHLGYENLTSGECVLFAWND